MLLKLLEDKNGEVQNLAVKWYVSPAVFLCMPELQIRSIEVNSKITFLIPQRKHML